MIPLFKVFAPTDIGAVVQRVFDSGVIAEGAQVAEFERAFAEKFGAPNTVMLNSATSALAMASHLLAIGPGDSVLASPMSCFATFAPFFNAGASLAWADVDPTTGNIDPADVARKITPHTKAVLAVHWAGQPFDYDALRAAAGSVPIVADAAHALGAEYKGRPIASIGDMAVFSYQAIKHLTTGDGGALIVQSAELSDRARRLRWFGLDRQFKTRSKWEQDIPECGFKYHMNNIAGAIGLAQLPYVDGILARHRSNSAHLDRKITNSRIEKLRRPDYALSSCWVYSVLVDDPIGFQAHMAAAGVAADVVHVSCDRYSVFAEFKADLPGVRAFSSRLMNIPCGWWLTPADLDQIIAAANAW
jgi:dTDP-4-amino-4,6-dideoxygalactose transaminase